MTYTTDATARHEAELWDTQVAQIFPQSIEKLPIFHRHYGQRMLCVGSRDGAAYDQNINVAEANTFHRQLSAELLQKSQEQLHTDGICMTMSASLWFPKTLALCAQVSDTLFVATPGYGDPDVLEQYLKIVDTWVLMIDDNPGPLCARIMEAGKHVEVLWGLTENPSTHSLPWSAVSGVHLRPRRASQEVDDLSTLYTHARSLLPQGLSVYDDQRQHSQCICGETLIWRQAGRSRIDSLSVDTQSCRTCDEPVPWKK